jgi:hypothetical protein
VTFYESVLDFDGRPDLEKANGVWAMGSAEAVVMNSPKYSKNSGISDNRNYLRQTFGISNHTKVFLLGLRPITYTYDWGVWLLIWADETLA